MAKTIEITDTSDICNMSVSSHKFELEDVGAFFMGLLSTSKRNVISFFIYYGILSNVGKYKSTEYYEMLLLL